MVASAKTVRERRTSSTKVPTKIPQLLRQSEEERAIVTDPSVMRTDGSRTLVKHRGGLLKISKAEERGSDLETKRPKIPSSQPYDNATELQAKSFTSVNQSSLSRIPIRSRHILAEPKDEEMGKTTTLGNRKQWYAATSSPIKRIPGSKIPIRKEAAPKSLGDKSKPTPKAVANSTSTPRLHRDRKHSKCFSSTISTQPTKNPAAKKPH